MSAYTTAPEVQVYYLGVKFESSSDYLTDTVIDTFITNQSAVMDSVLKKKYELPITDDSDLLVLKYICYKFVFYNIDRILTQNASAEEAEFARSRGYGKQAKDMMQKILDGIIELDSPQKSYKAISYNKTTVSTDDEEICR